MTASNQKIIVSAPSNDDSLSQPTPAAEVTTILVQAREQAQQERLPYAGGVTPTDAWALFLAGAVTIVDVRSAEERKFVGQVPGTLHVAWATGLGLNKNPRFVGELSGKLKKDQAILFLCRSGKRSAFAAEAATKAGFINAFNILEGFEGDINETQQRGQLGGWRLYGLPWTQD